MGKATTQLKLKFPKMYVNVTIHRFGPSFAIFFFSLIFGTDLEDE